MPQVVPLGRMTGKGQLLSRGWMGERQLVGVEPYAAAPLRPTGAVFQVTLDGAADGGQLAADLMAAAGMGLHHQKVVAVPLSHHLVPQPGFLCPPVSGPHNPCLFPTGIKDHETAEQLPVPSLRKDS